MKNLITIIIMVVAVGCGKTKSLEEKLVGTYEGKEAAIGPDGTVYVGSDDNKLYAIKTDSKGLAKSPWPMRGQNARHTGRVMKK